MNVKSDVEIYFNTLIQLLDSHSDVIDFKIIRKRVGENTGFIDIEVSLINDIKLEIFEYVKSNTVTTYRYHFMRTDNLLLVR